jgi:heme-degrading monooxygenase HmoA
MFARKVAVRLKANSLAQFKQLVETEIIPWLRTQEGFLDLITLATHDGGEIAAISFWEQEGDAQAYNASGYPVALKILGTLLDGTPHLKTFEVVSSTMHRAAAMEARENNDPQAGVTNGGTNPAKLAFRACNSSD